MKVIYFFILSHLSSSPREKERERERVVNSVFCVAGSRPPAPPAVLPPTPPSCQVPASVWLLLPPGLPAPPRSPEAPWAQWGLARPVWPARWRPGPWTPVSTASPPPPSLLSATTRPPSLSRSKRQYQWWWWTSARIISRICRYFRRKITRFFGVDSTNEDQARTTWVERRRRLAIKKLGGVKVECTDWLWLWWTQTTISHFSHIIGSDFRRKSKF